MTSRYMIKHFLQHRLFCDGGHTVIFAICLMLIPVALLGGCSRKNDQQEVINRVLVTTVSANTAGREALYNGTFLPRTQTMLSFRASGKVISRLVEVGDFVSQGQVIARLDSADYDLAQQAAQQQMLAAKADSDQAAREELRIRSLVADSTVSHSEYEQVLAKKNASAALTAQASRQLNLNENKVRYLTLTAPRAGVISNLNFEVGQVVGEGQPVATLSDQSEMELAVDLPDYMVKDIALWQAKAEFWSSGPESPSQKIALQLRTVSPVAAGMSQNFQARYRLLGMTPAAMRELKQGMSAQITMQKTSNSINQVISLPSGAVGKTNRGTYVWVVTKEHHLRQVPVNVLRFTETTVDVTGLTMGMQVVSLGIENVDDQMTVEAIEQSQDDSEASPESIPESSATLKLPSPIQSQAQPNNAISLSSHATAPSGRS